MAPFCNLCIKRRLYLYAQVEDTYTFADNQSPMNPNLLLYGLLASLVGPLLAALALVFGRSERLREAGRGLMLVSFALGTVLSMSLAFGAGDSVIVSEVFGRAQTLFFAMPLAFDRFAALFTGLVAFATLVKLWKKEESSYVPVAMLGWSALVVIVSSNVIGFMFSWLVLAWFIAQLAAEKNRLWVRSVLLTSAMALMIGWFLLTGGGLFNDFQTIAFYANGLEGLLMPVAFALMVAGATSTAIVAIKIDKAYVVALVTIFYALLRMSLFAVPVMYASVGVALAIVAWSAALVWRHDIGKSQLLYLVGLCGAVIAAVKFESWVFMNLSLFAALLALISTVVTTVGRTYLTEKLGDARGVARAMPWTSLCGGVLALGSSALLAVIPFTSLWMLSRGAAEGMMATDANVWFIVALAVTSLVATVMAALATVESLKWFSLMFLGEASPSDDTAKELGLKEGWPVYATTLAAIGLAVTAPSLLAAMGAEVITSDVGTLQSAVLAGTGSLRAALVFVALGVAAVAVYGVKTFLVTKASDERASIVTEEKSESVFGGFWMKIHAKTKPWCERVCSVSVAARISSAAGVACEQWKRVPRKPIVEYLVLVGVAVALMLITLV